MITKWIKRSVITVVAVSLVGGFLFGRNVLSYVRSSARSVQNAVQDSVPIEFQLKRARDLLEDIIPEMHANIRLIAQEEVEVAALKADIAQSTTALEAQQARIAKLRNALAKPQVQYSFGSKEYPHSYVKEDLSRRFELFKESELMLASKHRLLATRENSLNAAMQLLDKTKARKRMLEDNIEALASKHRLVKAEAIGSHIQMDNSKLAQTEKLIAQIRNRLEVAEKVLAYENRFIQTVDVDSVVEEDLLTQVDEYFSERTDQTKLASAVDKADLSEQLED